MPLNETAWILVAIAAYGIGRATAWFFKDMGKIVERWGGLIALLTFPSLFMLILAGGHYIAVLNNVAVSMIFALGFVIRLLKRNG